jgi:hypothetical protein
MISAKRSFTDCQGSFEQGAREVEFILHPNEVAKPIEVVGSVGMFFSERLLGDPQRPFQQRSSTRQILLLFKKACEGTHRPGPGGFPGLATSDRPISHCEPFGHDTMTRAPA